MQGSTRHEINPRPGELRYTRSLLIIIKRRRRRYGSQKTKCIVSLGHVTFWNYSPGRSLKRIRGNSLDKLKEKQKKKSSESYKRAELILNKRDGDKSSSRKNDSARSSVINSVWNIYGFFFFFSKVTLLKMY